MAARGEQFFDIAENNLRSEGETRNWRRGHKRHKRSKLMPLKLSCSNTTMVDKRNEHSPTEAKTVQLYQRDSQGRDEWPGIPLGRRGKGAVRS